MSWEEYKEIVKSNREMLKNNSWFKPAFATIIIGAIFYVVLIIYSLIQVKQIEDLKNEVRDLEEKKEKK